jgi:hypothetical protein
MLMTAANDSESAGITDIDKPSQCVEQQQSEEIHLAARTDSDMYVINDSNDHEYAVVNVDSDLTDSVVVLLQLILCSY